MICSKIVQDTLAIFTFVLLCNIFFVHLQSGQTGLHLTEKDNIARALLDAKADVNALDVVSVFMFGQ